MTAAILHDVVEDTDITVEDVKQSFGQQVALYVDALTISDTQDVSQSFDRTAELGIEALSIRAADLIQNSYYYHLAPIEMQGKLKSKFTHFLEAYSSQHAKYLADELREAYRNNVKNLSD